MSDSPEQVLSARDLSLIEQMAESMNEQEICDYFFLKYDELLPADREAFDQHFKRGRVNIKFFAMQKLKEQCTGRNGMQSALAILTRFGVEWQDSQEVAGVKSFKIVLDD